MCFLQYIAVPLLKLFVYETIGFDRIPKNGPAILVANHSSYIDGPMLAYFVEWYRGRWPHGIMVKQIYEKNWFTRWLFGFYKQIPTDGSVERAREVLTRGELLLLFPEGGRTSDGKIQQAMHTGLGVLAHETGASVIPIGISGTYDWWSRHRALPTFKPRCISVRVGKPIRYTGPYTMQGFLAFQRKIMNAVARLAHTKYTH